MEKDIQKTLQELGLRESEARVYIALTKLGEASASRVAKKSSLSRTTTISILDRLTDDGYISRHKQGGRYQYWIESPKVLTEVLEERVQRAKELQGILGALYRSDTKTVSAEVYDNKKSIQRFTEKLLQTLPAASDIWTIDSPQKKNYQAVFSDSFQSTLLRVKKKKRMHTRALIPKKGEQYVKREELKGQSIEVRVLPEEVGFEASVWILEDSVILFSGTQPLVVRVRHPLICQSMKSIVKFLWNEGIPLVGKENSE
jgi:sugar-specific transcriptional regulator TrmB